MTSSSFFSMSVDDDKGPPTRETICVTIAPEDASQHTQTNPWVMLSMETPMFNATTLRFTDNRVNLGRAFGPHLTTALVHYIEKHATKYQHGILANAAAYSRMFVTKEAASACVELAPCTILGFLPGPLDRLARTIWHGEHTWTIPTLPSEAATGRRTKMGRKALEKEENMRMVTSNLYLHAPPASLNMPHAHPLLAMADTRDFDKANVVAIPCLFEGLPRIVMATTRRIDAGAELLVMRGPASDDYEWSRTIVRRFQGDVTAETRRLWFYDADRTIKDKVLSKLVTQLMAPQPIVQPPPTPRKRVAAIAATKKTTASMVLIAEAVLAEGVKRARENAPDDAQWEPPHKRARLGTSATGVIIHDTDLSTTTDSPVPARDVLDAAEALDALIVVSASSSVPPAPMELPPMVMPVEVPVAAPLITWVLSPPPLGPAPAPIVATGPAPARRGRPLSKRQVVAAPPTAPPPPQPLRIIAPPPLPSQQPHIIAPPPAQPPPPPQQPQPQPPLPPQFSEEVRTITRLLRQEGVSDKTISSIVYTFGAKTLRLLKHMPSLVEFARISPLEREAIKAVIKTIPK
jgi:hypothetical protein